MTAEDLTQAMSKLINIFILPLARLELREERPGEVPANGGAPAAGAGLLVAGVRRGTARPLVRPLVRGPQPQPGGVLVTSVLTSCGDTGTQSSTPTSTPHSPGPH